MATINGYKRRGKVFKPLHSLPGPALCDFILLPYGYVCNRTYDEAKCDDELVFHGGETRYIRTVRKIAMDSLCDSLCRMRYGVSMKRVLQQWRNNAALLGAGKRSVSDEECLIVFYGEERSGGDNTAY